MNFPTPQPLLLCPLRPEQVDLAVALDQRTLGGLWSANGYQREIDSPNSDLLALVEPAAHQPAHQPLMLGLACLWAILEEAHITLLAVDLPYRAQGLGQALLYALLRLAWGRGLEWATLEVRPSNQAAIALYQKFGFESIGQRRGYYQDTGEDALILWRKGLQRPEFSLSLEQWQLEVEQRLAASGWQVEFTGSPQLAVAATTNSAETNSANFPISS